MPLTLVTGPANSGKAGRLLGELRARPEEQPILVVPSFADVERAQRELSGAGAIFGPRVVRFGWLFELVAERAAPELAAIPRASDVRRALILEEAVRSVAPRVLAASADRPGFARAALSFFGELQRARVEPARLGTALAHWAGHGPRAAYAREVAGLYGAYRAGLDGAGLIDDDGFALRALAALSLEPFRWGATPLYVHGFDGFTAIELDAIETVALRSGADVAVSLPYERGRLAFRSLAEVFERLRAIASRHVELEASADHYDATSRAPLHHLERSLFRDRPRRRPARDAVALREAGGQRAETELVAADVLALLHAGTRGGDVAVVFRDPGASASLVEQVFGAYGVPFSLERSLALEHTPLGAGVLALLRCATPLGTATDLLAYLRTPGVLVRAAAADRLERELRQSRSDGLERARALWEAAGRAPLSALDRLGAARDGAGLARQLDHELHRLYRAAREWAAGAEGEDCELEDARTLCAAHLALVDLHALALAHPEAVDPKRIHDTLAGVGVRVGGEPQPGRVLVTSPEGARARRFEAVFVCGLQEGEFPRATRPEPFLSDDDRRDLAGATGVVLPVRDDPLDRERFLFYLCASRARRRLVLSSRLSDEEGSPSPASFFREDVLDLFTPALAAAARRRPLAQVAWSVEAAPTVAEWERALTAIGPRVEATPPGDLRHPEVVDGLARRDAFSAGALEAYADCPVRWLVERELRPAGLTPEADALVRGRLAHEVLELTYRRLWEQTGERRVTAANLGEAERLASELLQERRAALSGSGGARALAALRRLEFDVLRFLAREAQAGGDFSPAHLELRFGIGDEGHGPVPVERAGASLHGVIDRVDTSGTSALVVDYKSGAGADPVASWDARNRLQAGIYMLAVDHLLGLEPAGAVYAPLRGADLRPRGLLAAQRREQLGGGYVRTDFREPDEFDDQLERVRERVATLVAQLREGRIECRPESCTARGGCAHPSICRIDGAA